MTRDTQQQRNHQSSDEGQNEAVLHGLYECDVCKGTFQTYDPAHAACPACGEPVREREVEYTDRAGSFTIGGQVTQL